MIKFYKKNKNVSFEKIFLNSKNLNDEFNYQKNINFQNLSYFQISSNKIPQNQNLESKYFAYIKFFESTNYLLSNINKDKQSIFEEIIYQNYNLHKKYIILQNGNLINYHFKNFFEYDNDLNQINFLKLKNNREKVFEIEKNVIIIF